MEVRLLAPVVDSNKFVSPAATANPVSAMLFVVLHRAVMASLIRVKQMWIAEGRRVHVAEWVSVVQVEAIAFLADVRVAIVKPRLAQTVYKMVMRRASTAAALARLALIHAATAFEMAVKQTSIAVEAVALAAAEGSVP